ncbi:MAG: hypothetical protein H0U92_13530 [Actinobacteria bacterium]|nr:hypothetical protein [Actinomycetota bacterium]
MRAFDVDATEELGFIASGANQGAIPAIGDTATDAGDIFLLSRAEGNATVQVLSQKNGQEITSFQAYQASIGVLPAVGVLQIRR